MIIVKSTIFIHVLVQSLLLVLAILLSTLPNQDIITFLDYNKTEVVSIISLFGFVWQFLIAVVFFVVPPFAYKNQMLDLTILLSYPVITLYSLIISGATILNFALAPGYWILSFLFVVYYLVSILELTTPHNPLASIPRTKY